jgi:hypothetical protein
MKLEDIIEEWRKDALFDDTELDNEALKVPSMHNKYLKILSQARLTLRKLKIERKRLFKILREYYLGNLNNPEDLQDIGREPWTLTVLKNDVKDYVDTDEDMITLDSKIEYTEEKIEVVQEIMKMINARGFQVNNAIKWRELTNFTPDV